MPENRLTVPDFVPAEVEAKYVDWASERVRRSYAERSARPVIQGVRPAPAVTLPAAGAVRPPRATAAILLGLLGFAAMTGLWSWLAATVDPLWWWFAAVGAALVVALGAAGVVQHRLRRRRRG